MQGEVGGMWSLHLSAIPSLREVLGLAGFATE
jgi:hypothetical protein